MSRFAIVNPGLLTTFQDLGRTDMLKYALSASGAMDRTAASLVNRILGNPETAAVLETTFQGLKLRVLSGGVIAGGGADLGFAVNGRPAAMWTALYIKEGDVIAFKKQRSGMRAYLGVCGGFDAPFILGARSVYLRGGLGAPLKRGDEIRSFENEMAHRFVGRTLPPGLRPCIDSKQALRVLPGPQFDYFSERGIAVFLNSVYTVSPVSDRQGIRTEGPAVERIKGPDIITDPTPIGGIQIPGNGVPIILHRDAQVTGGYAKIALLCKADLDRAGQLCPGDEIRFQLISRPDALALWKEKRRLLDEAERTHLKQ